MFSVRGRAVGPNQQGTVVGLRQTANPASAIIIPPIVGAIADWCGAATTFVILGARCWCAAYQLCVLPATRELINGHGVIPGRPVFVRAPLLAGFCRLSHHTGRRHTRQHRPSHTLHQDQLPGRGSRRQTATSTE